MKFLIENAKLIKIIIWDLDETFWSGTISDNATSIVKNTSNIELVKKLAKRGIISSICSKNEKSVVEDKLKEWGVLDYFVFNSINWESKGLRIANMLKNMGLRPNNALFIDDNLTNLAEAEFVSPQLMVATPDIIESLNKISDSLGKNDTQLERLQQYKILEKKHEDSEQYSSNLDFLRMSNIRVFIDKKKNLDNIERIYELIHRSNQLNFTKNRITKEELRHILCSGEYECGSIFVEDNYGKYGLIGFYSLRNNVLEHFLFSCRTMGMGVEQFVYGYLKYPDINIILPVSGEINRDTVMPDYITLVHDNFNHDTSIRKNNAKILMKGPCDLEVVASYLETNDINLDTEFNFIDSNGNQLDFYNHTINILNSYKWSQERKTKFLSKYSFVSSEAFKTNLFKESYDIVCLSPLMDSTLAVFRSQEYDDQFPFGLYSMPLTDSKFWDEYLNKTVMTARSNFKYEELKLFKKEFLLEHYTETDIVHNLEKIMELVWKNNSNTKFIIFLLAELPYYKPSNFFEGKEKIHKLINDLIKNEFSGKENVYLLDVNKYINSQADYFDNINHYSKMVYYKMASEISSFVNKNSKVNLNIVSKRKAYWQNIKRNLYKKLVLRK